jgi:prepilin-type processing-associated H-X9-DG protein
MPKVGAIRRPAAQVLFFEQIFSLSEATLGPGAALYSRDGAYPSLRSSAFALRHGRSGNIAFLDGHAAIFKWDYIYNQNPSPARVEKFNPDVWWNPNRDIP